MVKGVAPVIVGVGARTHGGERMMMVAVVCVVVVGVAA